MWEVKLREFPTDNDWLEVYARALMTIGKKPTKLPSDKWKKDILRARHSPIRRLHFSFELIGIPYYVSVHLVRHIHAQPFVKSQRNDRQNEYDRNGARQDAPVNMIWDMNAEEMMTIFNKRLCLTCDPTTIQIVQSMKKALLEYDPIYKEFAVSMCDRIGKCEEMFPCKKGEKLNGR